MNFSDSKQNADINILFKDGKIIFLNLNSADRTAILNGTNIFSVPYRLKEAYGAVAYYSRELEDYFSVDIHFSNFRETYPGLETDLAEIALAESLLAINPNIKVVGTLDKIKEAQITYHEIPAEDSDLVFDDLLTG